MLRDAFSGTLMGVNDAAQPDANSPQEVSVEQPSLIEDLDELQSPRSVQELEVASTTANALIEEAVQGAEANRPASQTSAAIAPPFIDFDKVSIAFGDRKILDQVSFHVGRGQTLCILG